MVDIVGCNKNIIAAIIRDYVSFSRTFHVNRSGDVLIGSCQFMNFFGIQHIFARLNFIQFSGSH